MRKTLYTRLLVLGKSLISDEACGATWAHTACVGLAKKSLDYNVCTIPSRLKYATIFQLVEYNISTTATVFIDHSFIQLCL
jgi:hypothetical protein